jgi:hypothetical protein
MAKVFKAVNTTIRAGMEDGSVKVFEAGEIVTGLTSEMMRELWDAGVLEQVDVVTAPPSAPETTQEKSTTEVKTAGDGPENPKGGDEAKA